jgi:hypothetical protein
MMMRRRRGRGKIVIRTLHSQRGRKKKLELDQRDQPHSLVPYSLQAFFSIRLESFKNVLFFSKS